jgi:phosphate transport system substrate-binding protein
MKYHYHALVSAISLLLVTSAAAAETLRVGGTGSATEMMRALGQTFATSREIQLEVVPSLGSTGALRAVEAGMLDIAVAGRRLSSAELSKGLTERAAIRSAWGLATSHRNPNGLKSVAITTLYGEPDARWDDGTAIKVILRPKGDSETLALTAAFPGMDSVLERLRARRDVPMAATDQDSADAAERTPGSLVSVTLTQLVMERRNLRMVSIDGVAPTFENFASGRYPLGKTLYLVLRADPSPASLRFVEYVRSEQGQRVLRGAEASLVSP